MSKKSQPPKKKYYYKGKQISDNFAEVLEGLIQGTGRDIQEILDDKKLEPAIEKLIAQFSIVWFRNLDYVSRTAKKYGKKNIYLGTGGNETSFNLPEAMSIIATFESELYSRKDIIWIKYKTINSLDGKMIVKVPYDPDEWNDDDLEDFLDSDDVMYMYYEEEDGGKIVKFHNPYQ